MEKNEKALKNRYDFGIIDLSEEDIEDTPEEKAEATKRAVYEIEQKKKEMDIVEDPKLEIVTYADSEERNAAALEILEREKRLQLEREEEWKKEKKHKKIVRTVKIVVLIFILAVLVIAYFAGYRIPIPEAWVQHAKGIYETAYNAVVNFFTNH